MKLLTPKEINDRKQAEVQRDIVRTEATKEALEAVTRKLNEGNARFDLMLANQRVRWAKEEEAAMNRQQELRKETKALEEKRAFLLVPMEERDRVSYDLCIEAEKVLAEAETKREEAEELCDSFEGKLDDLHEKETDLEEREQHILIREQANEAERQMIISLNKNITWQTSSHGVTQQEPIATETPVQEERKQTQQPFQPTPPEQAS